MYLPDQFREDRPEVLREFIRAYPLGALVTVTDEGLTANHMPMVFSERDGGAGVLSGHVARANRVWKSLAPDSKVLVIFSGPNRYITPSWYPSKKEHGKVVPTWNYSVVHAHGTIRFNESADHILAHLHQLTHLQEASRAEPWAVTDAPAAYVTAMLRAIVSFEISVTELVGKFKASQHRPESERNAVVGALRAEGVSQSEAEELIRAPNAKKGDER
jgi:transcriptional regulator